MRMPILFLLPLAGLAGPLRPVWDSGMLKEAPVAPEGARAVTDQTLILSGSYALRMDPACLPDKFEAFSVSAWVRPPSFDPFNEIFRIESPEGRVLFSFQHQGTFLTLGLYVNGAYQACSARIRTESLLDGGWHFVAATFDGKEQRVYLDGALAGQLPGAGTMRVARAPGFVGSNGGTCEFFQGGLDDLRLYTETLTPEAVTATLLEARQAFKRIGRECPPAFTNLFAMNLAARFPEACANYVRLYQQAPVLFVTIPELGTLKNEVENKIARLSEYMPLTDRQWAYCPAYEPKHWQAIKGWADRMTARLPSGGEALGAVLLDAADWPEVAERPSVFERVAPYVLPATPALREFTAEEARAAIEHDWLYQVGDKPDLAREISRTRALAARLGLPAVALDGVASEAAKTPLSAEKTRELYLAVRRIRRGLMLRNPAVDFSQLLLVDMPFPAGSEWPHETRHRLGYMAVPGGQLLVVEGLSLEGKVRKKLDLTLNGYEPYNTLIGTPGIRSGRNLEDRKLRPARSGRLPHVATHDAALLQERAGGGPSGTVPCGRAGD